MMASVSTNRCRATLTRGRNWLDLWLLAVIACTYPVPTQAQQGFFLNPLFAWLSQLIPWPRWFTIPGDFFLTPAYPDTTAVYHWFGVYTETGNWDYLTVKGEFPFARYFSLNLYNASSVDIASVYDTQIVPDPGSVNPYLPGQDRFSTTRDFTVWIVREGDENLLPPDANNIFLLPEDVGSWQVVVIRLYRVGPGLNNTGGVALPAIQAFLHESSPGTVEFPRYGINAFGILWETRNVFGQVLQGRDVVLRNSQENEVAFLRERGAGVFPNFDTAYIFCVLPSDTTNNAVVIRFKPLTFEQTFGTTQPFRGDANVRYWSFCVGSFLTTTSNCILDDQVVLDNGGNYDSEDRTATIVVGPSSVRDAVQAAGYNFLAYGLTVEPILIHRNILPNSNFNFSTLAVPLVDRPYEEVDQSYFDSIRASKHMGEFAPKGTRFTVDELLDWLEMGAP